MPSTGRLIADTFTLSAVLALLVAVALPVRAATATSALAAVAASSAAPAASKPAADSGGPTWASLTGQQQQVLAPLQTDWPKITVGQKRKWMEIAVHFPSLPADERQRVQDRMAEWARLPWKDRAQARMTFQEAKQLTPQERQARWEAYQALPESERRALQARGMPTNERSTVPASAMSAKSASAPPFRAASAALTKAVAPTVVQANPGATTTLMNRVPTPPKHQHAGGPRISAQPDQVNPATLLPQTGPQASARAASVPPHSQP